MQHYLKEARATLALALPIVVGQVSQMVMGVTDTIMVGRLGTVPLAAAAFAGSIFVFFFVVGCGILSPVAVLVAREHGAGNETAAGAWLRKGILVATVFSLLSVAIMFAAIPWLAHMRQPPEVIAEVNPYYATLALSGFPALIFIVFRQFSEAFGKPWLPMVIMLAGVVLNVFLNWILIYGNLGSPRFGLAGAGYATLVSRIASLAALILVLKNSAQLRPAWPRFWFGKISSAKLRAFLAIGIPSAGMLVFETGAFATITFFMGWFGAAALASHQIALTCISFTYMIPLGISMAVGMRVSKNIALGKRRGTRAIGATAILMSCAAMLLAVPLFGLGGETLARIFSNDPVVIALAAKLLLIAAVFQLFDATQVTASGALRGLPDVKIPSLVIFIVYWLIAIPCGLFAAFHLNAGPAGLWLALTIALLGGAFLLSRRFLLLTRKPAQM